MSGNSDARETAWRSWLPLLLACAMAAVCLAPLFATRQWMMSHDLERYPVLLDAFAQSFLQGNLYPRWLPDLYGGYGFPTFAFYQPGYFYLTLPFYLAIPNVLLAIKLGLFVQLAAGIYGCYLLARRFTDWSTAVFCALCFGFTPYLYVNLYVRGDLSELAAMLLTPWPLYFFARSVTGELEARTPRLDFAGLTGTLALLILCHPAPALFYLPAFCVFAVVLVWGRPLWRARLVSTALAVAGALGLTTPYWLAMRWVRPEVHFERLIEGYNQAALHTVHFGQLFSRAFEYGSSEPGSPNDQMSFQLGLPLFVLAMLGLYFGHRRRAVGAAFGLYAMLVLAMTPLSAPLWQIPSILQYTQFPWRLLSVVAVFQVLCIAGIAGLRRIPTLRRRYAYLLAAAFLVSAAWNGNQMRLGGEVASPLTAEEQQRRRAAFKTYANSNEFLPKTAGPIGRPRQGQAMIVAPRGVSLVALEDNDPHYIHYEIRSSRHAAEVFIQQLYFPGWRVEVDGTPIPDSLLRASVTADGRMRLPMPAGRTYEITAYYGGIPGEKTLFAVSAACLALLVGGLLTSGRIRSAGPVRRRPGLAPLGAARATRGG